MDVSAVVLPDLSPRDFVAAARDIEGLGLRGAWTYDHLSWRDLRDGPWHAAVPLLTAAACATGRVRLGFLVASPNFRHPVPFAKELLTLDHVSAGRLDVGVGAGGQGADATVLGAELLPLKDRADRFEGFVTALDALLREDATTGDFPPYSVRDARMLPGCVQRPRVPLTVAAAGPRAIDLAARVGDAWVSFGPLDESADWYAALTDQALRVDEACARHGRTLRKVALVNLDQQVDAARVAELPFDEVVVHWPRPDGRGQSHGLIEELLGKTAA